MNSLGLYLNGNLQKIMVKKSFMDNETIIELISKEKKYSEVEDWIWLLFKCIFNLPKVVGNFLITSKKMW